MIRVQFNSKPSFYNVEFNLVSDNSVDLIGNKFPKKPGGFKAYRLNGDFLGEYSDFNKVTKIDGGYNFKKP